MLTIEILSEIAERFPLSLTSEEDGRYVWPERWEALFEIIAKDHTAAELKELNASISEALELLSRSRSMIYTLEDSRVENMVCVDIANFLERQAENEVK